VASSKLHEAAAARPEPSDSSGRTIAVENFMVVVLSLVVLRVGDEAREATWQVLQRSADLPQTPTRVKPLFAACDCLNTRSHVMDTNIHLTMAPGYTCDKVNRQEIHEVLGLLRPCGRDCT
jgi:hypothetical protein